MGSFGKFSKQIQHSRSGSFCARSFVVDIVFCSPSSLSSLGSSDIDAFAFGSSSVASPAVSSLLGLLISVTVVSVVLREMVASAAQK